MQGTASETVKTFFFNVAFYVIILPTTLPSIMKMEENERCNFNGETVYYRNQF